MTIMIVYRMWTYQSVLRNSLGSEHGDQYTSVSSMFVESAGLYSIMSILVLGSYAANSNVNQIFLGLAPGIQLISSYLIIWRVASGRAWSRDTITAPGTSLQFNRPNNSGGYTTNGAVMSYSVTDPSTTIPGSDSSRDVGIPLPKLRSKESGSSLEKARDNRQLINRLNANSSSSLDK